ncbi:MAG TPA: antibiotic biosynthesis monooxygenase family protein [Arenicellales bacterium]|nr:antibiotic biosynthesis monooxygenase family protein [Arenicellales bacterium]
MISVTIEYFIKPGQEAQYETLADRIHPEVYSVDGFISVEGYESRSEPGKRLSLSLWRDEDAVRAWRQHPEHARIMQLARKEIFSSYRIIVSSCIRDYRFPQETQTRDS